MFKQIVGIFLNRVCIFRTRLIAVDDLRLDLGGHLFRGYLTLEDIIGLVAGFNLSRVGYHDILCIGFAVLRNREVYIRRIAVRDVIGKLHIEVHADVAV